MAESVLQKYYRRPKLQIKLPSNCLWYEEGIVSTNENSIIDILPMSGLDELKAQTPEILSDENFKLELIKSCVPQILKPEKLVAIDVNAIMFAIYGATYGNMYKEEVFCPYCIEKSEAMTEEERKTAIENSQICIKPQKYEMSIQSIIDRTIYCSEKEIVVDAISGLKIYLKPVSNDIVEKVKTTAFYQEMLSNKIKDLVDEAENKTVAENENIIKSVKEEINKYTDKMYNELLDLLICSIDYIETEDGEKESNFDEIKKFIENSPHEVIDSIRDKRDEELEPKGLPKTVKVECNCCHQLFDIDVFNFDPTNFFVKAS